MTTNNDRVLTTPRATVQTRSSMDIPRPGVAQARRRRRIAYSILGVVALSGITYGLSRLEPAAPLVENPYPGKVERGSMLRQVRGNGTLIPEEIRSITARHPGRVEEIFLKVGAPVEPDTVIVRLSNPELEQAAFDAEWQLKAAEAQLTNLHVQLKTQRLNQEATVASAQANSNNASLEAEINQELSKSGLIPLLTLKQSISRAAELVNLLGIEKERLKISADSAAAQLSVQQASVEQLRAQLQLRRQQVESLHVRAGIEGVLQRLGDQAPLQLGQQVGGGAMVAIVANPKRLMAELKIPETQAPEIEIGQVVEIDTRNGTIPGRVTRIDPAAQNASVTVDVGLEGALPRGARPDLNVDGIITIERLDDVLYVGRPVHGQPDSTVGLFKLIDGGKAAVRVPVKLGRTSVSTVEIVEGLQVGDQVILSDMSQWDEFDKVRLK